MAKLDVDIRQTVTWNFLVQLALTAISWGIAFVTSHTSMAKVGIDPVLGVDADLGCAGAGLRLALVPCCAVLHLGLHPGMCHAVLGWAPL